MATIKDIAKKLGISPATVSKGLNGASDISEKMRQSVLDAAVELGYKPKSLQGKVKRRICIMVEDMNYESVDQFGYEIISGFEQAAVRNNYEVTIVPANLSMQTNAGLKTQTGSREKYDTYMLKNGYSGAFLLGFRLHDDYLKQLNNTKVPTALLDNYIEDNPFVGYVGTDNFEGMKGVVNHLAAKGHRRIAMLCGNQDSMITERRLNAYKHFMWVNKIDLDLDLIAYGDYHVDCAPLYVPHFLEKGATAIICASDFIASGVIKQLYNMGKKVPEDLSVTGYDDLPLARYLTPALTTVRQNRVDLGKSAFILVDSLIKGVPISRIEMRPAFVERDSTGCVSSYIR